MTTWKPLQVTEREPDGSWEDCTWGSGVMHGNALAGANVRPNTRTEYEALRVAGGDGPAENSGDGSNLTQLRAGMLKRYGYAGTLGSSLSALKPGVTAVVQGSMGAFEAGHRLRRWDPPFKGGHAIHLIVDDGPRYWWQNPLAPNTYQGEYVTEDELRRYFNALPGAAVLAGDVGSESQEADVPIFNPLQDETATVAVGTQARFSPDGKVLGTIGNGAQRFRLLAFDARPPEAQWVAINGHAPGTSSEAGWVPVSALRDRQPVPEPVAPDCGPEVQAAVAAAIEADRAKARVTLVDGAYTIDHGG